jgi:four helix bundle protein
MKYNIIQEKSLLFSVRIVKLSRYLKKKKLETHFCNQIQRSSTSIAANIEEAIASISNAEFSAKMSISYKEARETKYWLNLLFLTEIISESQYSSLMKDCEEILKILFTILKNTRITKNENSNGQNSKNSEPEF